MIVGGVGEALMEVTHRRRCRIGWQQATAQVFYFITVTAFSVALLCYGGG